MIVLSRSFHNKLKISSFSYTTIIINKETLSIFFFALSYEKTNILIR